MTQGASTEGSNANNIQKKGLNLSIAMEHLAVIDTSIGRVFLFPLRVSDTHAYAKLPDLSSIQRIRGFLPCIASLSADNSLDLKRLAITVDQVDQLSDDEIETLAEAYASSSEFRETDVETEGKALVSREPGEVATVYLDRLLRDVVEERARRSRKIMESVVGSTQSVFDQVRKSSLALGSTLGEYTRLSNRSSQPELLAPRVETMHSLNEQFARKARERAEELEMVKLTGKMTAESAQTLKDLAEAATNLLEQLDERDKKSDKTTTTQINIAVWSVGVSAVLALFALIVSGFSYYQDKTSNGASDQWQTEVLREVKVSNGYGESVYAESLLLREQVERLASTVRDLEEKVNGKTKKPNQASHDQKSSRD